MAGLFVVLHTGVDGAGAVELFGQHQAGQLVGQCDASHADASLCGFFNAVVQPVGGTDDKGDIPGSAAGTLHQQGGQIFAGDLLALDTKCDEIRALAHRG